MNFKVLTGKCDSVNLKVLTGECHLVNFKVLTGECHSVNFKVLTGECYSMNFKVLTRGMSFGELRDCYRECFWVNLRALLPGKCHFGEPEGLS